MSKERNQSPVVGDTISLRLWTINSNQFTNVSEVQKVEIYYLDSANVSESNPDGRTLIQTITDITNDDTGKYHVDVALSHPTYVIGNYIDVWYLNFEEEECSATDEHYFRINPSLWFTADGPLIYDYSFGFMPNRVSLGSKRYITIEVTPNVPTGSDLVRYYYNLIASGILKISIKQICGDCLPPEEDLRIVVDEEEVSDRSSCKWHYLLDTSGLSAGVYDVWFKLQIAENIFISDKNQLEIFN
jgi:hypothetical protein